MARRRVEPARPGRAERAGVETHHLGCTRPRKQHAPQKARDRRDRPRKENAGQAPHKAPRNKRGTSGAGWWESARFHLCLPLSRPDPGTGRQGRFAPSGSRPERGAGKQFAWLGVDSGKMALSRPAWLSSLLVPR